MCPCTGRLSQEEMLHFCCCWMHYHFEKGLCMTLLPKHYNTIVALGPLVHYWDNKVARKYEQVCTLWLLLSLVWYQLFVRPAIRLGPVGICTVIITPGRVSMADCKSQSKFIESRVHPSFLEIALSSSAFILCRKSNLLNVSHLTLVRLFHTLPQKK